MIENNPLVRRLVRLALEEDIGTGDVTTEAVVPAGTMAAARVVAKAPGVLAGGPVARMVLEEVDRGLAFEQTVPEGADVAPGDVVMTASGDARSLLLAERTLLDFLMRLSGVATATRSFARGLAGTKTVLLDTRKTTPGLRVLEKYAARIGGARNHRTSLAGGVLIKNNHLALVDDLKAAVRRAKACAPALCRVEVEVRTMEEVRRAIEAGADVLLLDHMDRAQVREVLDYCDWKVLVEVSGELTPESAAEVAQEGPDFVSAGAITHRAPWLDFAMYMERLDR